MILCTFKSQVTAFQRRIGNEVLSALSYDRVKQDFKQYIPVGTQLSGKNITVEYIGFSRIDAQPMFNVITIGSSLPECLSNGRLYLSCSNEYADNISICLKGYSIITTLNDVTLPCKPKEYIYSTIAYKYQRFYL